MKLIKRIAAIMAAFAVIMLIPSCSEDDGGDRLLRMSLYGNPQNLDPQMAEDESSLIIIANMLEGLYRYGDGIENGVAESYTVSADGMTYTFKLRQDRYWKSVSGFEARVTADDFVFAFERLFDSATGSPHAEKYYCILNSEAVHNGSAGVQNIGVRALDDFTLEIKLAYPNADFLRLLSETPAMPCNREFFNETKGKYGLWDDATASNGAFYIKEWSYDRYNTNNYIIMRRNSENNEGERIYPYSLNFFIESDRDKIISDFISGSTDCLVSWSGVSATVGVSSYSQPINTLGVIFNTDSDIFASEKLREALILAVDRSSYEDRLPRQLLSASAIIPPGVTMLNKSYRELVSQNDKSFSDEERAKALWGEVLLEAGSESIGGGNILVSESFLYPDCIKYALEQWQTKLNFYCGLEVVSENEYNSRVASGDYDMLFVEYTSEYNSPESIFSQFIADERLSFDKTRLSELLSAAAQSKSISDNIPLYDEAEKLILQGDVFLPLYYSNRYITYSDEVSDLIFNPFTGQVYFRNAKKFD